MFWTRGEGELRCSGPAEKEESLLFLTRGEGGIPVILDPREERIKAFLDPREGRTKVFLDPRVSGIPGYS